MKDINHEIEIMKAQGKCKSNEKATKRRNDEIVNKLMVDNERRKMEKIRIDVVKELVEQIANIDAKNNKFKRSNRSMSKSKLMT